MIETISDVLTRISGIQQQLQSLQSGTLLDSALGASGGGASSASGGSSATGFAGELASAQGGASTGQVAASGMSTAGSSATGSTMGALESSVVNAGGLGSTGLSAGGLAGSGLASSALTGGASVSSLLSGAGGTAAGVSLSPSASSQLTSSQQQFASTLSANTGLSPNVVSAWLLAEESGGAAQSRQAAGNNDWLNIGYTDSGTYGSSDSVWSDPTAAANATASWLKGQDAIPGYGTASSGIQSILSTVGQTPAAQIQAIQGSGWSSGGYPSLGSLYEQVSAGTTTGALSA